MTWNRASVGPGKLSGDIATVLDRVEEQFANALGRFRSRWEKRWPKEDYEPAFWYREQQTKTYVTFALDRVCSGLVMQEPPVERTGKSAKASASSAGRADYWADFRDLHFHIEVKQAWVRYHENDKPLGLGDLFRKHRAAVKQVKSTLKPNVWKVNYGLALTVAPVWQKIGDNAATFADDNLIKTLRNGVKKKYRVRRFAWWRFSPGYIECKWKDPKKGPKHERYHGIVLCWSVIRAPKS